MCWLIGFVCVCSSFRWTKKRAASRNARASKRQSAILGERARATREGDDSEAQVDTLRRSDSSSSGWRRATTTSDDQADGRDDREIAIHQRRRLFLTACNTKRWRLSMRPRAPLAANRRCRRSSPPSPLPHNFLAVAHSDDTPLDTPQRRDSIICGDGRLDGARFVSTADSS